MVPNPFPPAGKDVGGFRAGKLFSYHLKTGMKYFSKASLQATATSRAIPAFLCLALPVNGGQVSPAPAAVGAAWGADLLHLQTRSFIAQGHSVPALPWMLGCLGCSYPDI